MGFIDLKSRSLVACSIAIAVEMDRQAKVRQIEE
jgi:hypothetical protein